MNLKPQLIWRGTRTINSLRARGIFLALPWVEGESPLLGEPKRIATRSANRQPNVSARPTRSAALSATKRFM